MAYLFHLDISSFFCNARLYGVASIKPTWKVYSSHKRNLGIMRIMHFKKRYDHTNCIFSESRLLKLQDIINLQTKLFVHKSIYSFPVYSGFITITQNVNTRRSQGLRIPLCTITPAQLSILSYICVCVYVLIVCGIVNVFVCLLAN